MPGLGVLAALNILFVAMPIGALTFATKSTIDARERTITSGPRPGREKLSDFYPSYAALGGAFAACIALAWLTHTWAVRSHAAARKYDPYARPPSTLLLGMPGIYVVGALLGFVLLDLIFNLIIGQPSWIQRAIEKLLS
jgi:hypothetical protein